MPKVDVDQQLLFGLLALQTGLIDQGTLFTAFNAWTREKARSMAEILVEQGNLDASRRTLLEGLVAEHLKMHGGDLEKSLAAIEAGRSTRERLAQLNDCDLAASLDRIGSSRDPSDIQPGRCRPDMFAEQGTESGGGDADRTSTFSVGTSSSRGLRFRVLRPHRSGGLGAVFVALDAELNREVALKQILDRHADDPVSRARFLVEAEITGGLEHPGIVPVYGLGTYATAGRFTPCGSSRATASRTPSPRFHADRSLKRDAGRRSLELGNSCGGSSTSATRSTTPTAAVCCTATQAGQHHSRQVRRDPGGRLGPGQGDGPPSHGAVVGGANAGPVVGQRQCRDAARLGAGDAGLHEPRASRGRARPARPALRRVQPGRDALRAC